jgi:hypothetical protein
MRNIEYITNSLALFLPDTSTGSYAGPGTSIGFDDCFSKCSNSSANPTTAGIGFCDAFTYVGGNLGIGSGTCYLNNGNPTESFTSGATNVVAAVCLPAMAFPYWQWWH